MLRNKKKIIRSVTVPQSICFFEEVMMRLKEDDYEVVVVTSPGKELDDFNGKLQEDIYSHVQVSFAEPIYDKVEKKPVMELRLPQKELIPLLEYLEEFLLLARLVSDDERTSRTDIFSE